MNSIRPQHSMLITLPIQQVQWLSVMLILVLALAQSIWMMLAALAVRLDSLTVPEALMSTVDMDTQKMLEYDVKVCYLYGHCKDIGYNKMVNTSVHYVYL